MKRARVKAAMAVVLWGVGAAWSPARAVGQCCGDCDGNGVVAINELVTAVNRALVSCQDDGVCDASVATCAAQLSTCNTALTNVQANLDTCNTNLSSTQGSLATCTGSLTSCNGNLTTCGGDLSTCTTNYTTCSGSLANCNAGTAGTGDVLSGKTFSSSEGLGVTGTMPNNGAVSITAGTTPQTIAAGYHNGSGSVAGDPDLTSANIKIGVNLFGVTGVLGCGNGGIDGSEQCDQNNLNGATCVSHGFVFGTLQCGANCAFDTSGCYAVRLTDNGDGTVTDAQTGLMWEKKGHLDGVPVACTSTGACPDPHDADNQYTYSADTPTGPPGTVYTVMLAQLNAGGGFAGHTDWRLPTLAELQGILDYTDGTAPVTNAVFDTGCSSSCTGITCSCAAADLYWTNDLVTSISGNAWLADFSDGSALNDTRDTGYYARAVR
jgi:hypothetical protein